MTRMLLVKPDNTVRSILIDNLRNWHYGVIVGLDGSELNRFMVRKRTDSQESLELL